MQELLGRTGKTIISGLALASMALILFGVMLVSETQKQRERIEDPLGLVFAAAMLVFTISLWKLKYRRWQALVVFVLIWVLLYCVNIIFNVTM